MIATHVHFIVRPHLEGGILMFLIRIKKACSRLLMLLLLLSLLAASPSYIAAGFYDVPPPLSGNTWHTVLYAFLILLGASYMIGIVVSWVWKRRS